MTVPATSSGARETTLRGSLAVAIVPPASNRDLDARFARDLLLANLTISRVTQTIMPSTRDYFDNRWRGVTLGPAYFVHVPTPIVVFAHQFVDEGEPPHEWAECLYNIRRWTPMPSGGHFALCEEPELLARDFATYFNIL
jgi:hypothetical protein